MNIQLFLSSLSANEMDELKQELLNYKPAKTKVDDWILSQENISSRLIRALEKFKNGYLEDIKPKDIKYQRNIGWTTVKEFIQLRENKS